MYQPSRSSSKIPLCKEMSNLAFFNFKMRMTINYEHVMFILNVTEGDGLHNHSCYIAYKRKEKNMTGFVLLCVNIAHCQIC